MNPMFTIIVAYFCFLCDASARRRVEEPTRRSNRIGVHKRPRHLGRFDYLLAHSTITDQRQPEDAPELRQLRSSLRKRPAVEACSICLVSSVPLSSMTPCGHKFHAACIHDLLSRKVPHLCPICRMILPKPEITEEWLRIVADEGVAIDGV